MEGLRFPVQSVIRPDANFFAVLPAALPAAFVRPGDSRGALAFDKGLFFFFRVCLVEIGFKFSRDGKSLWLANYLSHRRSITAMLRPPQMPKRPRA